MSENFNIRDFLDIDDMTEEEIDYCEFWTSANRIVSESGDFNHRKSKIKVNHNWNTKIMEWLEGYEDQKIMDYINYGWPLNNENTEINQEIPKNQKGARVNVEQVESYIKKEWENGSVIGSFLKNSFGKWARFSPLDTRPKKDSPELRIILNLSHPYEKGSVNHSINKETYADDEPMELSYLTVDDLCRIIRRKGTNKSCIFKRDLSKAYRQLWMDPKSIHFLGFTFRNKFYFDVTLSMGSSSVAFCCQRMTNAITYIYRKFGYEDVNYLDDLGAAEEETHAEETFDCLGWILSTIGIKESTSKVSSPSVMMIFLGILFNILSMTLTITPECLDEIRQLLRRWETKTAYTITELQVLLGKLNFASGTIRAGRIFLSRLINDLKSFPASGTKATTPELLKDIQWWLTFMEEFDGVTIMPPENWDKPDLIFSTDASLTACGGWNHVGGGRALAFQAEFPIWLTRRTDVAINELELMAFIIAIKKWGAHLKDRNILAYCDNQTTVEIINKGATRNHFAQACLREICYLLGKRNALLKAIYISTQEISNFQVSQDGKIQNNKKDFGNWWTVSKWNLS